MNEKSPRFSSSRDAVAVIVRLLDKSDETVLDALRRLKPNQKANVAKLRSWRQRRHAQSESTKLAESQLKIPNEDFLLLTEAADHLLSTGVANVYHQKKSDFSKEMHKIKYTKSSRWYYKKQIEDTETFGPFSTEQMYHWREQGYFVDQHRVFLRVEDPSPRSEATATKAALDDTNELLNDFEASDDEADMPEAVVKPTKAKAKKAARKKEAHGAGAGVSGSDTFTCIACGLNCGTRNQLFKHLKESGHAAPKR